MKICFLGALGFAELGERIAFKDLRSLEDFDCAFIAPAISVKTSTQYQGLPSYGDEDARQLQDETQHWQTELREFITRGKTIVVYGRSNPQYVINLGRAQGRETRSYYDILPVHGEFLTRDGETTSLVSTLSSAKELYAHIKPYISYAVARQYDSDEAIILSKTGEYSVGGVVQLGEGQVVFCPSVDMTKMKQQAGEPWATVEARRTGHLRETFNLLMRLVEELNGSQQPTPVPDWVNNPSYSMATERLIGSELDELNVEATRIELAVNAKQDELRKLSSYRGLLYETGAELERVVLASLKLIGFTVGTYELGDVEFDGVFSADGIEFLGECEGKETKPVDLTKIRQLSDNVLQQAELNGTSELSRPVLFGNAARLLPVEERKEFFTASCLRVAKRIGAALVRTPDLYKVVVAVLDGADESYRNACRKAIADGAGGIVTFPNPEDV